MAEPLVFVEGVFMVTLEEGQGDAVSGSRFGGRRVTIYSDTQESQGDVL